MQNTIYSILMYNSQHVLRIILGFIIKYVRKLRVIIIVQTFNPRVHSNYKTYSIIKDNHVDLNLIIKA
jgi:hypothetical protein